MKKSFRRLLSLLLVLLMVVSVLPTASLAANAYETTDETNQTETNAVANDAAGDASNAVADDTASGAENAATNDVTSTATNVVVNAVANDAAFSVGGTAYSDLNEAITAAENGTNKTIVVARDVTLSGSYTIPAGVTLLVPFDDANTLYTTAPEVVEAPADQAAYRTLTLNGDAFITVKGAISVGGKLFTSTNPHVCKPTGAFGQIKMNSGSQITVENGGNLYAWGYITGSGSVHITSGATVYECFQVTDWRGGSATMKFGTPANVKKVFPFSQYYVQNIEAPLTIEYGGAEKAYIAAYGENIAIGFVGAGGMFELAEGAAFTKTYDPATDRISFDISGNASLKGIKMQVIIATIDSAKYVLPITNNVNINIHSGVTTFSQDAALLPGVQVTIDHGAEMNVKSGANLYVYDADWWSKDYVWGSQNGISPVAYSPSGKGRRAVSDTAINVNGVLNVEGSVYTTAGGADIYSSGSTGSFVQTAVPGTETNTYQCTQSGSSWSTKVTPVKIPITPAKLHNKDGSYTETAGSKAGDTYVYSNGKWAIKGNEITITFDPNGGTGSMEAMSVNPGVDNMLTANTFTRENYTFTDWNTEEDGSGTAYADKATVNFNADTILYAQWTQDPVITFNANGGDGNMGTQTVKPNEATALTANTFTRADYDFAGWNTAADGSGTKYKDGTEITTSKNIILYAQWTPLKYHVRWLNWDGSILQKGDYTCEDLAEWDWDNDDPSRPEDENYTYVFLNRWTPYDEASGINGWGFHPHQDIDFTAVYNKFEKLTVTFDANGGTGTMEPVKIANGESDEYYTLPECGFTREGYTFNGWLITGMVKMTTWGGEEDLKDELWIRTRLLAFSNLTLKASWKHSDGWFTDVNGKQYYKDGEVQKTGWTVIDGNTYYLDTETGYAATGITALIPQGAAEEARCVFDAEGVFQSDVTGVYSVGENTYWLNSGIIEEEAGLKRVVKEDGEVNYYYFAVEQNIIEGDAPTLSALVKGKYCWVQKNNGLRLPKWGYNFDENGVILHDEDTGKNGILKNDNDLYYYVDGIKAPAGMIKIGDDYYYANSKGKLIVSQSYYCSRTNGLMKEGTYAFDAEGKLIPGATDKNGIIKDEDGVLRYYVNGKVTYVGLIKIDGGFYYVRGSGEVVANCDYYVTWTHGLKEAGYYRFDENGKLIGTSKNGIFKDNDGVLRYYVNGKVTYVGLIEIDGDFYYVRSSGEVVANRDYSITWTHDLMPQGKYHFDADGKMTDPPTPGKPTEPAKGGIVNENGELYYYVDGIKTYAGLIEIDGSYYYVNSSCKVITNQRYWISKTNDLLPAGFYTFDTEGKITDVPSSPDPSKNGIISEDGELYYYVDGVKTYAGLIEINGDYYYVNSSCKVIANQHYWISKTNGILTAGFYDFDAEGKLIQK